MKKPLFTILIMIAWLPTVLSQVTVMEDGLVSIQPGDHFYIDGDVLIMPNARFDVSADTTTITGDLLQDGDLRHHQGVFVFKGTNMQSVSGNVSDVNSLNNVHVELSTTGDLLTLSTDVEVKGKLQLNRGIILTRQHELFVDNVDPTAISGYFAPNSSNGTYAENDRYIQGHLARMVDPGNSTSYLFAVGSAEDHYNPIQIDSFRDGNEMIKVRASYYTEVLGEIDFTGNVTCKGQQQRIVHRQMTGEGFWQLESDGDLQYNALAYPK